MLASAACAVTRITCRACDFTGPLRSFGSIRSDDVLAEQITRESLERASIRILSRRYRRAKDTIMRIIHRVCTSLPSSLEIAERFCPQWSGVLTVDGKVVKVYDRLIERMDRLRLSEDEIRAMHRQRWLVGVDHGTGDLPHYDLMEEEGRIEWVTYFRQLQAIGYPLKGVVSDGNEDIPRAARFVYGPAVVWQRCTRHFIEDLRTLLPSDDDDHRTERQRLEVLIAHVQRVIEADTIEAAAERLAELTAYRRTIRSQIATVIINRFKAAKEHLCAHFLHPELRLPHTNNDAENLIRQLNQRLKTIGRFMHWRTARSYCNAWALLRRFTPFTDCVKSRRHRNGKCPLQLAGVDTRNIDPLKLRKPT